MDATSRTDSGPQLDRDRPASRTASARRWVIALAVSALPLAACSSGALDDTAEPIGDPVAAERVDVDEVEAEDTGEVEVDVEIPEPTQATGVAATTTGPHAFNDLAADGVTPISYDPCQPIPYVVRTEGAPAEGDQLIVEALAMVSEASGLTFVAEGPTDELPSTDEERELYQYDRYGDRIAPVLIAWSDAAQAPELGSEDGGESETLGYAYSDAVYATDDDSDSAPMVYATGEVVLDAPDLQWELDEGSGYEYVRAVIAHELAHLVGLDHVEDAGELMNPMIEELVRFGPGDLQGLAILGQGVCYPEY